MEMKYFNILWVRQHSGLQGAREGTLCVCVVLVYTWKHPEHKLVQKLVHVRVCACVFMFVCRCLSDTFHSKT